VTQSNAATAEESASAGEELEAQSRELNQYVGSLLEVVHGSSGGRMELSEGPWSGPSLLRTASPRRLKPLADRPLPERKHRELAGVGAAAPRNGDAPAVKNGESPAKRLSLDAGELEKF